MFRRTIRNRPYTMRPIAVTAPDTGGGSIGAGWKPRIAALAADETGIDPDEMDFFADEFEYWDSDHWVAGGGGGTWAAKTGSGSDAHGGVVAAISKGILGTSTLITSPNTEKFFVYAFMQTPDNSGDAAAFHIVGFSKPAEAALFGIGLVGSTNNGGVSNYGVHVYPGGGGLLDLGVPYSSGFHHFYLSANGTTLKAWMDSSTPVTTAQTNIGHGGGSGWVRYMLTNSGSSIGSDVDRLAYAFERAA